MTSFGTAFVAIWHGIQPGSETNYLDWHTHEHMPERVGIPGFLQGRRYVDWALRPHQTFTLYEGAHLETFRSPGYLARLNAPTAWSNEVQPRMTDFLRGGCETILSLGKGLAGAITTVRLRAAQDRDAFERRLASLALDFSIAPEATSVHIGRHAAPVTSGETAESRMRPSVHGEGFSHVVLIEGISTTRLAKAHERVEQSLSGAGAEGIAIATYPLDFALRSPA